YIPQFSRFTLLVYLTLSHKGLLNEPREELQLLREEVQHLTRRLQRLQERQRDDSRQDAALDAELPPNLP
ncbi:hypothetical protein K3Z88_24775, partial [Pseudomonas aeruginosa]|nr:hypothetical protein [Pseudomonas aeruginosa]